jgi:phosphoribosylformimino-5-aminoimidazole carboxamide ribotide isomerase
MLIIPAIDIMGGKVVRLSGGDFGKETVYGDDPVKTARRWEKEGAKFLHIVDLDGAREGEPRNFEAVSLIIRNVSIPAEVGGGIRNRETIKKYIEIGAKQVVLGTEACNSPEFVTELLSEFGEKIAVSVDSSNGWVAIRGWRDLTSKSAAELIKEMESIGIQGIIWTDVKRDGLMGGINIKKVKEILKFTVHPITIAGGISSSEDILKLRQLKGIRAIIIGKALYTGAIQLKEAMEIAEK